MNVCVFCSANDVDDIFRLAAKELALGLVRSGHSLVVGGSTAGLMKTLAENVFSNAGEVITITAETSRDKACENVSKMLFGATLQERKQLILEKSDGFVVMAGGTGTLDEVTEMLELKKLRMHDKPIIILNQAGFYDGLYVQLRRMADSGFLSRPLEELVAFAEVPGDVLALLASRL